jgi:adenylate cyclase
VRQLVKAKLEIAGEMTVFPKGAEGEIVLSHVIGIGKPYDIHVSTARDATKKLEKPVPVSFRVVDGKHTQNKQYFGGITAIGRNSAIMETQAALKEFANFQVEAGGDLFCKVTERSGDACTLDFTAIPSSFDKWMRSLV